MILPPVLLFVHSIRTKKIRDWDLRRREDRLAPVLFLLIFLSIDTLIVFFIGDSFLQHLFLWYFFWMFGYFLITLVWKISGHTGSVAMAGGLMISWFGWGWWWMLLLTPLVAWTRIIRKNHTVLQTVGGALFSWWMVIVYYFFLNT
jgi:membrane-associated phospholipid phosphatase